MPKSLRKFTGKMNCVVRGKAPGGDLEGRVLSKREEGGRDGETLSQNGGKGWDGSIQAGRMLREPMLQPNCLFSQYPPAHHGRD